MMRKLFPLVFLLALAAGFGLGLTYAWVIAPVQYVEAEPRILRDDFKDHFRSAIAAAYASNADLERARVRLNLLGDPDPSKALVAQAQRMLAAGESPEAIQRMALLASALDGETAANQPTSTIETLATETATLENVTETTQTPVQFTSTATAASTTPEPTIEIEPSNTPRPQLSATPRPTRTPTATLGAPYQLIGEETICEPDLAEGLLQVVVFDIRRNQIPGAEIIITWNNGEEHIFTGLKPELGYGYADFLMTPDVTYSVRMADGGTPASELSTPECETEDGDPYPGGLRLSFQQP
ncbi:MAG: hypothetical protein PVJ21_11815 [Anaerolineales bacterium]|jgi:hypothetical protein